MTACPNRFQHDSTSAELSSCFICGWQGMESIPNSPQGVRNPSSAFSFQSFEDNRDLWVCLVCGFIGCGNLRDSHIQRHYEEHLHTYAMNTDSGRVWDFAGDGYVHRLILSHSDDLFESKQPDIDHQSTISHSANANPSSSDPIISIPQRVSSQISPRAMKVVEVSSPHYQSVERSHIAPITSQQEEHLVSNKLEATAYHYNQLVHWQLERNRELYEMRLQRVRDFAAREGIIQPPPSRSSNVSNSANSSNTNSTATWAECVLYSLSQEKQKVQKQCEALQQRLSKMQEEIDILEQFHKNLTANQIDYQVRIDQAKAKLADAERLYR